MTMFTRIEKKKKAIFDLHNIFMLDLVAADYEATIAMMNAYMDIQKITLHFDEESFYDELNSKKYNSLDAFKKLCETSLIFDGVAFDYTADRELRTADSDARERNSNI